MLEKNLGGLNIAEWTRPRGGYFISLNVPEGCAGEVIAKAQEAGVKFTSAGATYPYGRDPRDRNIRIAPTRFLSFLRFFQRKYTDKILLTYGFLERIII